MERRRPGRGASHNFAHEAGDICADSCWFDKSGRAITIYMQSPALSENVDVVCRTAISGCLKAYSPTTHEIVGVRPATHNWVAMCMMVLYGDGIVCNLR